MSTLHDAIRKLNPDIHTISGDEYDTCVCVGGEKPAWNLVEAQCAILDLACCKKQQAKIIDNSWRTACDQGFSYTYNDETHIFDGYTGGGDKESTLTIISGKKAKVKDKTSPATKHLTFYALDKTAVVFDNKNDFVAFGVAYEDWRDELDQKRIGYKAEINEATTIEQINSIVWED